tara:strand:+ start:4119 stop:5408 length:1290 start_codon:yes stop_codon:yes gene_type:complete
MRVLVLGADGYLGWPTCMYLARKGHEVMATDGMLKRKWEVEVSGKPINPPRPYQQRAKLWNHLRDDGQANNVGWAAESCPIEYITYPINIADNPASLYRLVDTFRPEGIVHYAEQPSAPYSQATRRSAVNTQTNNIVGTLNLIFATAHLAEKPHIVKLGSMGEYGTPNLPIREGWLDVTVWDGLKRYRDRVLYPKRPGSWYHLSKVHDSHNLEFACRTYGLRCTDLNQGVVYGVNTDETAIHPDLRTSLHYDAIFGTAINRFCAQAATGVPLTVYGEGGQTRGFLDIRDTLRCVELALDNPPASGEFRVFNQFTQVFTIQELALFIRRALGRYRIDVQIENVENPRVEAEQHFYAPKATGLKELGLDPHLLSEDLICDLVKKFMEHRDEINLESIQPSIKWRSQSSTVANKVASNIAIGVATGGEENRT